MIWDKKRQPCPLQRVFVAAFVLFSQPRYALGVSAHKGSGVGWGRPRYIWRSKRVVEGSEGC